MSFRYETEILDVVKERMPALLDIDSSYAISVEFPISYRKIDLCLAPIDTNNINFFREYSVEKLPLNDLWILAVILYSEAINYQIDKGKNPHDRYIDSIITKYQEFNNKYPLYNENYTYRALHEILEKTVPSLIIIELKLNDWLAVIKQTLTCRQIGDIVCVVLDGNQVSRIKTLPFMNNGIGLYFAYPDDLRPIIYPQTNNKKLITPENIFNRLRVVKDVLRNKPKKWKIITD